MSKDTINKEKFSFYLYDFERMAVQQFYKDYRRSLGCEVKPLIPMKYEGLKRVYFYTFGKYVKESRAAVSMYIDTMIAPYRKKDRYSNNRFRLMTNARPVDIRTSVMVRLLLAISRGAKESKYVKTKYLFRVMLHQEEYEFIKKYLHKARRYNDVEVDPELLTRFVRDALYEGKNPMDKLNHLLRDYYKNKE